MEPVISTKNLWKLYLFKPALRGVSIDIMPNRITGVLGENGSGKSTLLKIISGMIRSSQGKVFVKGMPVSRKTRTYLSYLNDNKCYYSRMSILELLKFLAKFYPSWNMLRSKELLDFLGLHEQMKVSALSKGQYAKLKIVCAFSWESEVVLLDEPFNGIDPLARRKVIEAILGDFKYDGQSIVLTSHLVEEIEHALDDVHFIKDGKIVISGNTQALKEQHEMPLIDLFEKAAKP